MSAVFNAEEVLEIAIEMERAGAEFYNRAVELVEDQSAKEMLRGLAAMESGHEIIFEEMRADPDTLSRLLGDPDGDAAQYLRAIARAGIFSDAGRLSRTLKRGVTMEDVMKAAIEAELASIAYYEGIRDAMSRDLGKEKVEQIIFEEMRHVIVLSEKLEYI